MFEEAPSTKERARETGSRGSGGDWTLEIDRSAERLVLKELEALADEGYQFAAVSEERGEIDFGASEVKVIIDPIDGSLNAQRRIPHYALSVAVAGRRAASCAFREKTARLASPSMPCRAPR